MDFLKNYDIVLASNSPRRKELLAGLDISYRVSVLPDIDESYPETLQGEEIPLYIAKKKAEAYKKQLTDRTLLITADTIVWLDGRVYGKPLDKTDARAMLHALSGKTHTVKPASVSPPSTKRSLLRHLPKFRLHCLPRKKSIIMSKNIHRSTRPELTAYKNG